MTAYLETDRLLLREFSEGDADALHALYNDPAVMEFLNGGKPVSRVTIETEVLPRFLGFYAARDGFGYWACMEKPTGSFVGWFGLDPLDGDMNDVRLGYRLSKEPWGLGYATEGSRLLIDRAFSELGARCVRAQTMAVNVRSRHVMEKCGMIHERTFHEQWDDPLPGTELGEVEYAITRDAWLANRSAESQILPKCVNSPAF